MSKLIGPGDLSCFATCLRDRTCTSEAQLVPAARLRIGWIVPEGWQPCANCCELSKAQVATPPGLPTPPATEDDC